MSQQLSALFVDFDSYFASVEQYLQPHLKGQPVGVAPVMAESSCCIAVSYEARAFGIKTGTRISDARQLCPEVVIVPARPEIYVQYHKILLQEIEACIHIEEVLSIDEVWCWLPYNWRDPDFVKQLGLKIQQGIRKNVGETITCSIGVAPNKWLAKIASKMNKPNGVFIIKEPDLPDCLYHLELRDIHGIGRSMELRLHTHGVHSVYDLCHASMKELRTAWGSIEGEFIWRQLRCEEIDKRSSQRQSYSQSHILSPEMRPPNMALGVMHKLTQKAVRRMRAGGYLTSCLTISIKLVNKQRWRREFYFEPTDNHLFFAKIVAKTWLQQQEGNVPVFKVSVVLSKLHARINFTPSLFEYEDVRSYRLNDAMEEVIAKHGKHAAFLGGAMPAMLKEL